MKCKIYMRKEKIFEVDEIWFDTDEETFDKVRKIMEDDCK